MVQSSRLDRARAAFLGMAIGDALGAPLEGLSPQQIKSHYTPQVDDYVNGARAWKKKPYRWRLEGLYSDDTQQALVLADVLLHCGCLDERRVAELYLALATPASGFAGAHRGIGRSFRQVLEQLRRGVSPDQTGQVSAGIGAAMRIAPLAIYYANDPGGLFEAVLAASLMTHRDCRSLAGALAVAYAVGRLLDGEAREPSFLLWLAADVARAEERLRAEYSHRVSSLSLYGRSLSRSIAHVESLLDIPRSRALAALVEEANRHGAHPTCQRPTMGFPPACIPTCLYLLLTTDSLEEALIEVINLGGDADTAGAILGAMAGAHYGLDAIPERWLAGLQNREGIDLRAQALCHRDAEGLGIPDLVETEWRLSRYEVDSRELLMTQRLSGGDLGANHHHRA